MVLAAHGCCCCCCLYVVGGLIGAAFGGAEATTPAARRTVRVYWLCVLLSVALGAAGLALSQGVGFSMILMLFYLPLAQFNASFLTLCAKIFLDIDLPTLGRITWKSFFWTVVTLVAMLVGLFAIARLGA